MSYDPSAPGVVGSLFGLPYQEDEASVVVVPVPWDVTTSYLSGAAVGPEAILNASPQLDLELFDITDAWKTRIWMAPNPNDILRTSNQLRPKVERYLDTIENYPDRAGNFEALLNTVNKDSLELKNQIKNQCAQYLNDNKLVGILGGEHSVPLGLIEAISEKYDDFGILQIDAHMDLRRAYEGFDQSHASIMYNAVQFPQVSKLVQVGIRDYCPEESQFVKDANGRVAVFYNDEMKSRMYEGTSWNEICKSIVEKLPTHVYISFDIDGLNPQLCPGTGTPVPGGLEFDEAMHLIKAMVSSGKKIIGFDLCEVAPKMNDNAWNANVGARVLYNLCCWAHKSSS